MEDKMKFMSALIILIGLFAILFLFARCTMFYMTGYQKGYEMGFIDGAKNNITDDDPMLYDTDPYINVTYNDGTKYKINLKGEYDDTKHGSDCKDKKMLKL